MLPDPIITIDAKDLESPKSLLRKASQELLDFSSVPELIRRLNIAFYSISHADGISAIQIGIPLRVALVNLSRIRGKELILINPMVVSTSGRHIARREGCLSLPNYSGRVIRRNKITLDTFDENANVRRVTAVGYEATVIQHELDHMDGLLYWDRMEPGVLPQLRET